MPKALPLAFGARVCTAKNERLHQETPKDTLDQRDATLESYGGAGNMRGLEEFFERRSSPRPFPNELLEDIIRRRLASFPAQEIRSVGARRKGCARPIGQGWIEPRPVHAWLHGVLRKRASAGKPTKFADRVLALLDQHLAEAILYVTYLLRTLCVQVKW